MNIEQSNDISMETETSPGRDISIHSYQPDNSVSDYHTMRDDSPLQETPQGRRQSESTLPQTSLPLFSSMLGETPRSILRTPLSNKQNKSVRFASVFEYSTANTSETSNSNSNHSPLRIQPEPGYVGYGRLMSYY